MYFEDQKNYSQKITVRFFMFFFLFVMSNINFIKKNQSNNDIIHKINNQN